MSECGGCQGLGSHRRHCPRNPNYDYRLKLADDAETLGDRVSGIDHALANHCWFVAGGLRLLVREERGEPATDLLRAPARRDA